MSATKITLIACSMMEDEIQTAITETDSHINVIWMERGLHDSPDDLRDHLQRQIDELQDQDVILLGYGLCGNGTAGLKSENTKLVIPRFDDCINALLCTGKRKTRGMTEAGVMYITRGWTLDDKSMLRQFDNLLEQFEDDEDMLEDMIDMMYGSYHGISVIDTGCYDMEPVMEYAKNSGELLHLEVKTEPGTNRILHWLISGEWDKNFIILEPGQSIEEGAFNSIS